METKQMLQTKIVGTHLKPMKAQFIPQSFSAFAALMQETAKEKICTDGR